MIGVGNTVDPDGSRSDRACRDQAEQAWQGPGRDKHSGAKPDDEIDRCEQAFQRPPSAVAIGVGQNVKTFETIALGQFGIRRGKHRIELEQCRTKQNQFFPMTASGRYCEKR
ncbi:hypothetical protein [Novosphingobium aquimarinum]|uniref:hypothetical protein n=1 Tax=Novosphingobium aquimarinum TaxID=2682494 RepID=UPI001E3F15AE|nr:hypothetical protein [Novosphingobium aquimarinum]